MNIILSNMECIVCTNKTKNDDRRVVCNECLKPTCWECFCNLDLPKKCGNCRTPLSALNCNYAFHTTVLDFYNKHRCRTCKIGAVVDSPIEQDCSDELLILPFNYGFKFCCSNHVFTCDQCGNKHELLDYGKCNL